MSVKRAHSFMPVQAHERANDHEISSLMHQTTLKRSAVQWLLTAATFGALGVALARRVPRPQSSPASQPQPPGMLQAGDGLHSSGGGCAFCWAEGGEWGVKCGCIPFSA